MGVRLLDAEGIGDDAAIDRIPANVGQAVVFEVKKDNAQMPAIGERDSLAQPPLAPQTVQSAGYGAGVLAQVGGFPFKPINLLDHLNGDQDVILGKVEQ